MILLDSNILVYALVEDSPKYDLAQQFISDNITESFIAHQNILETIRVVTHATFGKKITVKEALLALEGIVNALEIISPRVETYLLFTELVNKYELNSNRIFDAYLVATMLSNGINEIGTDNERDFKQFKEIKVINPFK